MLKELEIEGHLNIGVNRKTFLKKNHWKNHYVKKRKLWQKQLEVC